MLLMRDAQMVALSEESLRSLDQRAVQYLAAEHPTSAQSLGSDSMATLVDDGIDSPTRLRLRSEGAVAVWIELGPLFGGDLRYRGENQTREKISGCLRGRIHVLTCRIGKQGVQSNIPIAELAMKTSRSDNKR
jgi:hypothetical protein